MSSGPLPVALAVLMVGVAVFCGGRMLLALVWRRPAAHDVDLVHIAMGASMAGMLTGSLTGRWTDVWLVAFSLATAWFAWRAVHELVDVGPARPGCGHVPHLVGSAAMLYMLIAMHWTSGNGAGGGSSMAGMAASTGSLALPLVVSSLLVLNALLSAGQVFFWPAPLPSPALLDAAAGPGPASDRDGWVTGDSHGVGPRRRSVRHRAAAANERGRGPSGALLAPRCGALCLVAMSGAMAYMFLTVRP